MKQTQDKIIINGLVVSCLIGVREHEQQEKQNVIITIKLSVDTQKAGETDELEDTVSYSDIAREVTEMVENSHFQLLEKLAQAVADVCLKNRKVKKVKVLIEKPQAIAHAESAAIKITRENE